MVVALQDLFDQQAGSFLQVVDGVVAEGRGQECHGVIEADC